jgi:AraC-like DNA-binding protein
MNTAIQFCEPAKILRHYIDHYYIVELSGNSGLNEFEQKPISDGYVEMFIGYHNTVGTCYTNNGNPLRIRSAVIGAQDFKNSLKGMVQVSEPKTFKFASIIFKPDGFYGIFKIPTFEIYDSFVETSDLLGNDITKLQKQLDDANDINERKDYLDKYFINLLVNNSQKHYSFSADFEVINIIKRHKGIIKMLQLANETKVSESTIQRNFKTALGLSPKEYCKIISFKNLFDYVN